MNFGTVIQAVEANQEKSENEFTMEDLLGLVVDMFNAAGRSFKNANIQGVSKVEDIRVEDDNRFIRNLCKMSISMGRIYNNNKDLFSENSMTVIERKAIDALSEVEAQAVILDKQIKEAEEKQQELESRKNDLEKKKEELYSIEFQSRQLEEMKSKYEDMLARVDTMQQEIDNYTSIQIPNVEDQIKTCEETRGKLNQEYSDLCSAYDEAVMKNREIQQEIEDKEKAVESAQLERDNYRQKIFEAEKTKTGLQEESNNLSVEEEQIGKDIEALELQKDEAIKQIEIIKDKKMSLDDAVRKVLADQNYWEVEQDRAQAEYDRILQDHAEAKNNAEKYETESRNLSNEIDILKKQCEEEKAKISNSSEMCELYKSRYAEIKKEQEDKCQDIDNQKKRMENARIEFYILKADLERVIRNSQIQHENLEKEQLQLADQIKPLLELVKDSNLQKIYENNDNNNGYEMVRTLRTALETVRKQTNDQIRHEKDVFADTLRKLETDEIYGGV